MKRSALTIITIFVTFVAIFIAAKGLFMCYNSAIYAGITFSDICDILVHGLPMDCAMAGYLTIPAGLLVGIGALTRSRNCRYKAMRLAWTIYEVICAFAVSLAIVADIALYASWGFKLDMTPVFYFMTSPSAAMASVESWQWIGGTALILLIGFGTFLLLHFVVKKIGETREEHKWRSFAMAFLLTCLLFIPIRGGFTVSSMNLSSAYFSNELRLNHAAVNPLFSFMYSATHQNRLAEQFHYFTSEEARRNYRNAIKNKEENFLTVEKDSLQNLSVSSAHPDIYFVILESFSAHLMPSLGGEPLAMRLDSIASEGALFTRFYASSFRTDRALPAILSGYPAQPASSIMKYVEKTDRLPSLPRLLKERAGYQLKYFYGGDANFTNMKAYLMSAGFEDIVSDKNFPLKEKLSKWGAPDGPLFQKVWQDCNESGIQDTQRKPQLVVIQTSSSHEPFDVPFRSRFVNPRANAFAYADSCLGNWYTKMKDSPKWENTLIVITGDHYGCYPENLTDPKARHHIPLILAGGALKGTPCRFEAVACQSDIAATLLSLLGMKGAEEMPFSHDIFDTSRTRRHAFFSEPDYAAFVDESDSIHILKIATADGDERTKAYLQTLYEDFDRR